MRKMTLILSAEAFMEIQGPYILSRTATATVSSWYLSITENHDGYHLQMLVEGLIIELYWLGKGCGRHARTVTCWNLRSGLPGLLHSKDHIFTYRSTHHEEQSRKARRDSSCLRRLDVEIGKIAAVCLLQWLFRSRQVRFLG